MSDAGIGAWEDLLLRADTPDEGAKDGLRSPP